MIGIKNESKNSKRDGKNHSQLFEHCFFGLGLVSAVITVSRAAADRSAKAALFGLLKSNDDNKRNGDKKQNYAEDDFECVHEMGSSE